MYIYIHTYIIANLGGKLSSWPASNVCAILHFKRHRIWRLPCIPVIIHTYVNTCRYTCLYVCMHMAGLPCIPVIIHTYVYTCHV